MLSREKVWGHLLASKAWFFKMKGDSELVERSEGVSSRSCI
jgi:hypothetical protein